MHCSRYEELYHTVILWWFEQNLLEQTWLTVILQDNLKLYGELFDVHVFLNYERNHQSVSFNPLATHSAWSRLYKMRDSPGSISVSYRSVQCSFNHSQLASWKRAFLTCPCHEIYRDEAVSLKNCNYNFKNTIFVNMCNLGQFRENLIFCQ